MLQASFLFEANHRHIHCHQPVYHGTMREWGLGKFQVFVLSDLKKQVLVQHLLIRRVVQAVVVQIYVVQESSAVEGLHIFGY